MLRIDCVSLLTGMEQSGRLEQQSRAGRVERKNRGPERRNNSEEQNG